MPGTIEEVLKSLETIIEAAIVANDPVGYFAYVYQRTTKAVQRGIMDGRFEDNLRMTEFDVSFANLYLDAHDRYQCGESCPVSWQLAFNADAQPKAILQHVMLGMNAHINLDLGVAAGKLMRGKPLENLGKDFRTVNTILQEIIEELQERVGSVSPVFAMMDRLGKSRDEKILDFSMRTAREQAWVVAEKVWNANGAHEAVIDRIDGNVYRFGQRLARPKSFFERTGWKLIAAFEANEVGKNIEKLRKSYLK